MTSATMAVFDPPHRLVLSAYQYAAPSGPLPFEAEFVTEFVVEPLAPEMVGSLLFTGCLWAWVSAEDKYLPGELADCFSYELEPGRMPGEYDIKWCMEGIQQRRAASYQDSEW